MPGGPLFPHSAVALSSSVFPDVYQGAGAGSKEQEGLGVAASLAADATWRLRWTLPPALPTGIGKLRLDAMAVAISGAAKVNPKWAAVAMNADPSSAVLSAEGTQTITWGAGDADKFKQLKVTLDATTLVAGRMLVMDLVFEAVGWTLANSSNWLASVLWE